MAFDLKIIGGTIVDGSGKPGYRGDVGVQDGKIAALGEVEGDAKETIDAEGRVVAPGFVDIHTHYDAQVVWDRMMTISPWHGVTTVVMGNCGFGVAPTRPEHRNLIMRTLEKVEGMSLDALKEGLGGDWPFETFPQYLDALEKIGTSINVGVLAGHTPIRMYVMGEDAVKREARKDEIVRMKELVREAMSVGALGFATSHAVTHNAYDGNPVPSRLATIEEIEELVGAMAESGRGIMQATIGPDLFFDEFAEIAGRYNRPVTWTALLAGMTGPGSHRGYLDRTAELVDKGYEVVPQVACRPLNFDFNFEEPFPFESRPLFRQTMTTDREGKKRIYSDPEFRKAFKEDLDEGSRAGAFAGWYKRTVVSYHPTDSAMENTPLVEAAQKAGKHPVDYVLDLSLETDFGARFRLAAVNYDESEVAELLDHADKDAVLGLSDAGAHASQLCDACFSTYLLGHWVREKGQLSLERAVNILTQRPANVFGITDRGLLAIGRPADVVVFDPQSVGAGALKRVYDLPGGADRLQSEAFGIDAVIVNGTLLRRGGADAIDQAGPLPGRLLRGGAAA